MRNMTKILSREEQIHLMLTAKQRQEELTQRVLADPLVREVLRSPAPTKHKSAYMQTKRVIRTA